MSGPSKTAALWWYSTRVSAVQDWWTAHSSTVRPRFPAPRMLIDDRAKNHSVPGVTVDQDALAQV
ncbi:hypothetical protein ACFOLD_12235 [Kocuria carniphila]|uniref:hypothetical protein n=1 Tax=Kocuria carniphila TaxID=262208 RepID=UPI003619E7A4